MNKFWDIMYSMETKVANTVFIDLQKKVYLKCSHNIHTHKSYVSLWRY